MQELQKDQKEKNSQNLAIIKLNDLNEKKLFGKPEKYSCEKYLKLEDFSLDEDLIKKFIPIARKLNLSQDSLEMLLDMALEMSRKQNEFSKQNKFNNDYETLKKYNEMFSNDNELPNINSVELKDYMRVADLAYSEFASEELKEVLVENGLNCHPQIIKMFHKIGELLEEDDISYGGKPAQEELSPAQILYGLKD